MNQHAYQEITKMLNAFPQQASADIRGLLLTYDEDTTGIPDQAIVEAAQRFRSGRVEGQNLTFAPSVAEFCAEARKRQEYLSIKSMPRLPPVDVYHRGPLSPFEVKRQKALTENSDRPIVLEDASLEDFKRMSKAGDLPPGSSWVASLGIIFGPRTAST